MTICIGVVCDNRKRAIFACDRMLTSPGLSVEFEHDEPKYEQLSPNCVGLTAGMAMPASELFDDVRQRLSDRTSPTIKQVAEATAESFRDFKMKRVEEEHFKPRGLTIDSYLRAQRGLNENVVLRLEQAIESYQFPLEFIIAGADNTGAHIFEVSDPGHVESFQRIGFHAIGSGLPHTISTFISHRFTPATKFKNALYVTFEAKRNAEKAPGVGRAMDIGMVDSKGTRILVENEIRLLDDVYNARMKAISECDPDIQKMIDALPLK